MYLTRAEALKPTAVFLDCHQAVNVVMATIKPFLQNIRFHLKIKCYFHVKIGSSRYKRWLQLQKNCLKFHSWHIMPHYANIHIYCVRQTLTPYSHNDKGKQLKVSSPLFTKSQCRHKYEELIVSSAAQREK